MKRHALGLVFSVMLIVVLSACTQSLPEQSGVFRDTAFPGGNGSIVFTTNRDLNLEVYAMNADGSNQTNLTNTPTPDNTINNLNPSWSPDGTRIAFRSNRDGNDEIYVMNADGSNQTRLTTDPAFDSDPSWSPDGTKIIFRSLRDGNSEIYVMNADGSNPQSLTNDLAADQNPAWSPDGSGIAFASDRDGNSEIYVMNADGSNPTRLTNNPAAEFFPNWSPDGNQLAFSTNRDGNSEIYVMNADGTSVTNLTNHPANDSYPAWSPDGTKITFRSTRDGNDEIYVMNADGSGQTRLTTDPKLDFEPDWQPLDPILLIEDLVTKVDDLITQGVLTKKQGRSLKQPLNRAIRKLQQDQPAEACTAMDDFINEVNALTPDPLDALTAAALITDAESVLNALPCDSNGDGGFDPVITQLLLTDLNSFDEASGVGIDGDLLVVGARGGNKAFVYEFDGTNWSQTFVAEPAEVNAGDLFGRSTAVSEGRFAVAAPLDDERGTDAGAVYIYEKQAGVWTYQRIAPAGLNAGDRFGDFTFDLDGDTLMVGAPFTDAVGTDSGAVWVFELDGGVWEFKQLLTPNDGAAGDIFGSTVRISGKVAIIASPQDDDHGENSGSMYVFEKKGKRWRQADKVTAAAVQAGDRFGGNAALDGNIMLVGARFHDAVGTDTGAAFLFDRSSGDFVEVATLYPNTPTLNARFGVGVALADGLAFVGQVGESNLITTVDVFDASTGDWVDSLLPPNPQPGSSFGSSLAATTGRLLIGARYADDAGTNSGAAYVVTY